MSENNNQETINDLQNQGDLKKLPNSTENIEEPNIEKNPPN